MDLPDSNLDVLMVSETWLNKHTEERLIAVQGYNVIRLDRQTKHANGQTKTGGGLCIYHKESLQVDQNTYANLNTSNETIEIQWITVTRPHTKKLLIGNVYRPPSGNLKEALKTIGNQMSEIRDLEKYETILMGDFNADASTGKLPPARILKQFEAEHTLQQVINKPTRYSRMKRATIDLAFTNMKHCTGSGTLNYNISDHKPIYIIKKKIRNDVTMTTTMARSYRNYTHEQLRTTLTQHTLNQAQQGNTPNHIWEELEQYINSAIDKHCPMVKIKIRAKSAPFITSELINLQNDRDYFTKKADLSRDPGDRFIATCLAKVARKEIRKAKANYYLNQAVIHNQNHKKFWHNYNKIQPKTKPSINNILDENTGIRIPDDRLPDKINDFFINIGEDLASKCTKINEDAKIYNPPINQMQLVLNTVDAGIIKERIKKLDPHKPSGLKDMSSAFAIEAMTILIEEFTRLFNLIITTGIFPDRWKVATVTPIPKVSSPNSCNELRPISILPLPGRLMEQIIHDQIKQFLENSHYFADEQNGFRNHRSTTKALSTLLDQLLMNTDNNELSISVFLDFKKAFDTIDHKILLHKLQAAGIGADTCKLIKNYLSNRSQTTRINGHTSGARTVRTGVPQGSTLGPLLFLIFINDLPLISRIAKFILFADDTVLTIHNKSLETAAKIMNTILKEIHRWCAENKLTLNAKKTEYVIFGTTRRKRGADPIQLTLGDTTLREVQSYKYLGTILDATLNIGNQIAHLNQILATKLTSFRKMRYCMSEKTAAYIYKATILPIIDYNDIIYGLMTKQQENKLQRIQNRALRIVFMGKKLTVTEMHSKTELTMLAERRELHLLILMFRRSFDEAYIDQTVRTTRQGVGRTMIVPKPRTNRLKNAPAYRGSVNWNKLPLKIRDAKTILAFKNAVRSPQPGLVPDGR